MARSRGVAVVGSDPASAGSRCRFAGVPLRRWLIGSLLALALGTGGLAHAADGTHEIQSGETLSGIAHHHGVSVAALCRANAIQRDSVLQVGASLKIPRTSASSGAAAPRTTYKVKSGDTLGGIARHHHTTVATLKRVNHLGAKGLIRVGQALVIAAPSDRATAKAEKAEPDQGMQRMTVGTTVIHYYEPTGPGRKGLRPVIMYLHGRGGHAASDCRRWATVARSRGWLVCPEGPEDRGAGARGWNNNWAQGRQIVMASLDALRAKYGRRIQLYGNTLVGFSEGAYVAMNVGIREPRAFNRWLVLGADTDYWGAVGLEHLHRRKDRVRRVYLITGQNDQVVDETKQVQRWLREAGVAVRSATPNIGHKVALDTQTSLYRDALVWLDSGKKR